MSTTLAQAKERNTFFLKIRNKIVLCVETQCLLWCDLMILTYNFCSKAFLPACILCIININVNHGKINLASQNYEKRGLNSEIT